MILKKNIYKIFFTAAIMIIMAACGGKSNTTPDTPDNPDKPSNTEINGTTIAAGNNIIGLITDSSTGKGIAGVPVTDGFTYTVTDANGVYQMVANRYCRKVYYSTPSDYQINLDPSTHLPLFYSTSKIDSYSVNRNDFKLTPMTASEDKFTLVMIGDPQCQTSSEVARYTGETIPDIQRTLNSAQTSGSYQNAYAMTLGDIVFDSNDMWYPMKKSMENVKLSSGSYIPFFNCIGNHDHNSLTTSEFAATENFVNNFGPTDYSYNRGKAHIVVMDDVMCTSTSANSSPNKATWNYEGGFSASQYKWLQDDLNQVTDKTNKLVILCCHIPFRAGASSGGSSVNLSKYYGGVLTLLSQFKEAHIMIGHTHYSQNFVHSDYTCKGGLPIYEHIHGAACGGWWSCNSDVIGGPNGYNIYQIEGSSIVNWLTKGTNRDINFQLRVYDGNQTYGTKYTYNWYKSSNVGGSAGISSKGNTALKDCFVAQVWDDDDKYWTVEMYKDGSKVGNFTRLPDGYCSNICIASYFFNELGKNTSTWTSTTASHYWYYKPISGDPSSETGWEVRATQVIPSTGKTNLYSCGTFTTNSSSF